MTEIYANDYSLNPPRSTSMRELYSFQSETFRALGYELGTFIDEKNRQRKGLNWFDEYCKSLKYSPNLYDPEFLLKEPDFPNSWCRWCLPDSGEFHDIRRKVKRFRNKWAHFEDFELETLAEFLSHVRKLTTALNLPMSKVLPRLQEHIRFLADNPEVILDDKEYQELRDEVKQLKDEKESLTNQIQTYEKWFPVLTVFDSENRSDYKRDSVCLHFNFDGMNHTVKAEVVPGNKDLAEIQFQLPMEIPLGEGDVVAFKGSPGAYCVSMTAIVSRAAAYRIQISIDYPFSLLPFAYGHNHLSKEEKMELLEEVASLPDGPFERWKNFLGCISEYTDELELKCAVIQDSFLHGTLVAEVISNDLVEPIIEAVQLQDNADAWLLSTPDSPLGSISNLDRFSYSVGTERAAAEAIRLGWYQDGEKSKPDINRVMKDLYWEPVSDVFIKRN